MRGGVRVRIVVKVFARGSSARCALARAQGIASPTPSLESLRVMLAAAAGLCGEPMALHALDVSQAFMHCQTTPFMYLGGRQSDVPSSASCFEWFAS